MTSTEQRTPTATTRVCFSVNDTPVEVEAPGGRRLLDVLRVDLGLTGTKEGCGEGECGSCSVTIDDDVTLSCLVPIAQAAGCRIRTVEGLAVAGRLGGLQEAFLETGATQCGLCTPGMLMAAEAFLASGGALRDGAIRAAIAGNLCRCTGYTKIIEAIALAGQRRTSADRSSAHCASPALPARRVVAATTTGATVLQPASVDDALRLMATHGARPIAGATDVMAAAAAEGLPGDRPLLDLRGLDELRGIDRQDGCLVLGALTTYTELRRSPLVATVLPVLAAAASTVGAVQVQNRGTIGGNVATGSPAGDLLPVLLATDATIVLVGPRGERVMAAATFWTGCRRTARDDTEVVAQIRIPLVRGRQVRYRKVGTRRAQAVSKVVLAVSWNEDAGRWREVRVAVGSVADRPIRATATEAILEAAVADVECADRAAATIETEIRPIDDVRSTAAYRRTVTGRVLRRIILDSISA